jgi:hypothetical protein
MIEARNRYLARLRAKNKQRETPVSFGVREDAVGGYD